MRPTATRTDLGIAERGWRRQLLFLGAIEGIALFKAFVQSGTTPATLQCYAYNMHARAFSIARMLLRK